LNAILHFLLNGYEIWSLVLKEEGKLAVFSDRVLKKILGLKPEYVARGWSNFDDEELRNFYSSDTISLSLSMALQPFGPWPLFQFLNPIHSR
jgi:hypothetical protein